LNNLLFTVANLLSKPPGFYALLVLMIICSVAVPMGFDENVITFGLSVAAIVITGVVLIQGYRDTAAIHAKLDEIIVAMKETRNELVGLEHEDPKKIEAALDAIEKEAERNTNKP
jgi:low affinity Fe/Cu permease